MKLVKRKWLWWVVALSTVVVLTVVCAVYLNSGYAPDFEAIRERYPDLDLDRIVLGPPDATSAFIFYPGGKVDHRAYAPLMTEIAERGILCILVEMPYDLAIFDLFAAEELLAYYPHVEDWYIGGHSLGGVAAAICQANYTVSPFDGLVLLGAYSSADLAMPSPALKVLSIYGSEDGVMNAKQYERYIQSMHDDAEWQKKHGGEIWVQDWQKYFTELVIEGGNHAGFGMYGPQKGDGEATISTEAQIAQTADAIAEFILAE